jgi:glutamine synthetase
VTESVPDILDHWRGAGVTWVRFELPDLHGTARVKLVPIGKAADYAAEGLNFYGGAQVLDSRSDVVPGSLYNTEKRYADQLVKPDPSTAALVPWEEGHARFICSAYDMDGSPRLASPRQLLERVLGIAGEMGFGMLTGSEYENYFLQPDGTPLFGGWHIFNPVRNVHHPVVLDLLEQLPKIGSRPMPSTARASSRSTSRRRAASQARTRPIRSRTRSRRSPTSTG